MKFMEFNKNIKDNLQNVINLVGDDYFLIRQTINNVKSLIIKELEEFNYTKLDADKMKKDELNAVLSTLPMGNDYRLVVLTDPNKEVVKFINTFDFTDTNEVVICTNADKSLNALEVDCAQMDKTDIAKYVISYLKRSDQTITERALDYLIEATNGNMSNIFNELNKITSYATNGSIIDMDIVTNLVANTNEYLIYMLTDAIDNKNYSEYQKILNDMSKGQAVGELYSYMGKYFRRMQYISLSKNDDELSKILSIKPYAIKMARQKIAKNGIKYYIDLYQKYVDLDFKIKSGKISANNALYELVF